jgi:superfamily II DNA/RNA helicase
MFHHPTITHRIGRTGRRCSGAAITISAERSESGGFDRKADRPVILTGNPAPKSQESPPHRVRQTGRPSAARRHKPAPSPAREEKIATISDMRTRRLPALPARPRDEAPDLAHFPAFLLRPIRVKA